MNWRLKYSADWRSLVFVLICLILLIVPLFIRLPLLLAFIWVLISSLFSFSAACITHNHLHTSIFKQVWLNEFFNLALTIANGSAATYMVVPHHYNHHKYQGNSQDWSTPKLLKKSRGMMRLLRYPVAMAKATDLGLEMPVSVRILQSFRHEMQRQNSVLIAFIVLIGMLNWANALIFIGLPWVLSTLLFVESNLLQHDGCYSDSKFNHSRNFTGAFTNWFIFNTGYHTIHHLKPKLHWSLLPEEHKRIVQPYINQNLDVKSILGFVISYYLCLNTTKKDLSDRVNY